MTRDESAKSTPWMTYHGVDLFQVPHSTVYFYTTPHMAIDADGAPNAYNPDDSGLDALGNAEYPNGHWRSILVPDPRNPATPYVQPAGDPFPGFFVAMTSLQDGTKAATDTRRYSDARTVPYVVFPGGFYRAHGTGATGDLVMVRNKNTGKTSAAIIGDIGPPHDPLGEVSVGLAVNLGGHNPNPRNGHGAPDGPFEYVVFPGSRGDPSWPLTLAEIQERASALLTQIGGWPGDLSASSAT
jgi:hypothetical protein